MIISRHYGKLFNRRGFDMQERQGMLMLWVYMGDLKAKVISMGWAQIATGLIK